MSNGLAKNISTKVSFKITIRKRHVFIDIRWPFKWNQYFYLGIWEDERPKIIFLTFFQLITWLNSQNRNETSFLMNTDTNLYTNICISNWHNSSFDSIKMKILLYFSSLHGYWLPITSISLVHISLGEMEWCEKRAFQLLKIRKMKVCWNIKTMCLTDILLTVRSSSMKDYTCH
jgi:hypothetical protein